MRFLGDYAEFGRPKGSRDKKRRRRKIRTLVKGGPFGLGLKRGPSMYVKVTGDDKADAIAAARAFYNREKRAGRMR